MNNDVHDQRKEQGGLCVFFLVVQGYVTKVMVNEKEAWLMFTAHVRDSSYDRKEKAEAKMRMKSKSNRKYGAGFCWNR